MSRAWNAVQHEAAPLQRAPVFDGLRRARFALDRARCGLHELEQVASQLRGPFQLARAQSLWTQLEVCGGGAAGDRDPSLFARLRAARARVASAEMGLRAAEAELFASRRQR